MFNGQGLRFVDEGEDMRNFTYAEFGRAILEQPGSIAFQIWDAEGAKWLRKEEYADEVVERTSADSLDELADKLVPKGLDDKQALLHLVQEYNAAVERFATQYPDIKLDPSKKDGLSTISSHSGLVLGPNKTNWATQVVKPPFLAVKVTCGITFTFGGLKADPNTAAVLRDLDQKPINGLYVAGKMLGGLFYGNYPGGSGLTSGAVFGRKTGREAAWRALKCDESTTAGCGGRII